MAAVHFPLDGTWTDLLADQTFEVPGNRRDLPVPSHWGRILRCV
jgi:hypothetical protein